VRFRCAIIDEVSGNHTALKSTAIMDFHVCKRGDQMSAQSGCIYRNRIGVIPDELHTLKVNLRGLLSAAKILDVLVIRLSIPEYIDRSVTT